MSHVIQFTPKRELSSQQNLNDFIVLARDNLTLWSDLEGFSWDAAKWVTTHKNIRFTNFEHVVVASRTAPNTNQLMHPAFAESAKAYLRYQHTLRPNKRIAREMTALRAMEFALRQDMAVPDITKFEHRHWCTAVSAMEPATSRQLVCEVMLGILKRLADLGILTVDPWFWRHPYVGRHGYDATNGAGAPAEVKAKKAPDQDALLAVADVFSRGESETLDDSDIMVTCITALLLSAPMRIGEFLRFRLDCLREDTDRNGELQCYLAYWVPKTHQFERKPIPMTMGDVAKEAIKRLGAITEEGRRLACYMETNPTKFYRHANCPSIPDDQELTPDQVVQALGFANRESCASFVRKHTSSYAMTGFTLNALWQLVLTEHLARNPHFPYQEAPESSTQAPLKMSDSLLCFRRLQLATTLSTSPVLLAPFNGHYYSGRLKIGKRLEAMNFFTRHAFETNKLKSHSLRHLLNRQARSSGVSLEMLTEWSSRTTTRQTRTYLHDDPAKAAAKGALALGTTQEQEHQKPVTNEEAALYGHGPFHRSRYGICRRSWRAGPCNKFAACLNCSELLMCKGDKLAAEIIQQDRDDLVRTYNAAQQEIANGERAASLWTEKAGPQIERLDQLLDILHNPDIPDGSPIEMAGADFSHEKVIVSEKAKAAGVQLLDRKELGLSYGEELLACLDLLREPDDA
ncbi:integrase [Pseudomonas benzenivorans]|uniref:Integrase n=1 Tax=Pseudomonas benzenivorans TaxID=556533 RepID=A0ABY5H6Q3_9PSED|nr:integrase [Pseudomonas benzenivorans]UTW07992.1 integrase [Pseudomonas benzenivorans]